MAVFETGEITAKCDACILDNVLEHIEDSRLTLDECHRITKENGGLVIAVPGVRGFESDPDHKRFYDAEALRLLDRLTHHCHIVEAGNESYRFQHSSMAAKSRIKSREQTRKDGKATPPEEPL